MTGSGSEERSAIDQLLDLTVYAPLGLLLNLEELLPQLAQKGHQQVDLARMMGKYAVRKGTAKAKQQLDGLAGARPTPTTEAAPAAAPTATDAPVAVPDPGATPPAAATEPAPDPALLGILDYDALSASQVVPRLGGLGADELDAVRRYETANRGRKTILSKIAQLQAAG